MVNLSLDLVRMEQGSYEFRPRPVDLAEVARRVAADLESQAASKGVSVQVRAGAAAHRVRRGAAVLLDARQPDQERDRGRARRQRGHGDDRGGATATTLAVHVHNDGAVPEAVRAALLPEIRHRRQERRHGPGRLLGAPAGARAAGRHRAAHLGGGRHDRDRQARPRAGGARRRARVAGCQEEGHGLRAAGGAPPGPHRRRRRVQPPGAAPLPAEPAVRGRGGGERTRRARRGAQELARRGAARPGDAGHGRLRDRGAAARARARGRRASAAPSSPSPRTTRTRSSGARSPPAATTTR